MQLREYQKEAIVKINEMIIGEKKICAIATGGGKTIIMSEVAKVVEGRVLIVVDQNELRQQTIDKLIMVGVDTNLIGSVQGKYDEVDKKIIIATRQSLTHGKSTRLDRMLLNGEFQTVIVDECHRACAQIESIIKRVGNVKVIGFTATPYNTELKKIFDGFIYEKDILSLIQEGFLVSPRAFRINTNTDISGIKTVGGEYVQSQLSDVVNNNDRNNIIVKAYLDKAKDIISTIVFATSIEHANSLTETFNLNGVEARSVDSTNSSDEREKVLSDFKKGLYPVLVNVAILTTGYDYEAIGCVIMACPTKSKTKYVQCLGRGLRIAKGKEECVVLDIVDNAREHSLLNSKSIFDMEDGETIEDAKKRRKEEKEEELAKQREEEQRILELEKLELEEINLFNENLYNIKTCSNLDWFFNTVAGVDVAILSLKANLDCFVYNIDGCFKAMEYKKLENFKYELNDITESNNLAELIEELDSKAMKNGSSFISKSASWKSEMATKSQVKAVKGICRNKMDAHRFFSKRSCWFALKDILK